ncbi:DUF3105 domain-containing protein [Kitasatospora camelliae]|uniref:DUF3105 domain-containing protein n=1 Tax=Kitasatospora camelliae TaxID=3156397 RepID=A0AAU8K7G7_9ACTN
MGRRPTPAPSHPRTGRPADRTERRARIAELRAAEHRRERRRTLALLAVAGLLLAGLAGGGALLVLDARQDRTDRTDRRDQQDRTDTAGAPIPGVRTYDHLSRTHVTTKVAYPQTPPVGGDHHPVWLECTGTVYDRPVADENAVHSLEHGAVWVTYNAKAGAADVQALAARVRATPYSFLSPYPDQPGILTLTAWGAQLVLESASDPRVEQFFTRYVQGPQTQEPGASCSAGSMPLTRG